MVAVSPEDDSRHRYVLNHYRFDPERRERRNVVVGAWDTEAEFSREERRLRDVVARRKSAPDGDARESLSGAVLGPGDLAERRRARVLERSRRCARRVAAGQPLRDGPAERVTRFGAAVTLNGRPGQVDVSYTVGLDPVKTGFDVVAPGQDWQQFVGYPVLDATVTADAPGYSGLCGWVQLISNIDHVHGHVEVQVDRFPFVEEPRDPLTCFGYLPRFFDAPANPGHPDGLWLAELFLVEVDVRHLVVTARLGLSWGYYLRGGKPFPLQVQPVPLHLWRIHANQLRRDYPGWAFD
jgi:hypothetical protein